MSKNLLFTRHLLKIVAVFGLALAVLVACDFTFDNVGDDSDDSSEASLPNVDFSPFQELGTLGGSVSFVNGLADDRAVVVGESNREDGSRRAFVWKDGVMTEGKGLADTGESRFYDVSPYGEYIIGEAQDAGGTYQAILNRLNGSLTLEEFENPGSSFSEATAYGATFIAGKIGSDFVLWKHDTTLFDDDLDPSDTYNLSEIEDVDSWVLFTSSSPSNGYIYRAFDTSTNVAGFQLIDDPAWERITPAAINDNEQIAVTLWDSNGNNFPGIVEADGSITQLTLPATHAESGNAYDINNSGEVVGNAFGATSATAVYWSATGVPKDLNTLINLTQAQEDELGYDAYILTAEAINNNGDIAGEGYFNTNALNDFGLSDRQREGYLLPGGTY